MNIDNPTKEQAKFGCGLIQEIIKNAKEDDMDSVPIKLLEMIVDKIIETEGLK